jgi:DNA-binding CsgD family transcriptional regulator
MQPRDRLTAKEIQVATLVWQGLTNRDIGQVLGTSEQVVKNYLRSTFDKLGLWTRLELALYVASHGGSTWHLQLGLGGQSEDEARNVDAAVKFPSHAPMAVLRHL